MKKFLCMIVCAAICFCIAACSKKEPSSATPDAPQIQNEEAYIYVGRGEAYKSYVVAFDNKPTANELVTKLGEIAGWNLSVDAINHENGKVTIDFSKESAVYTGDCSTAQGEFKIEDKNDLICTVLDSVWKTIKENISAEVSYSVGGYPIKVNGKVLDPDEDYSIGDGNRYSVVQAEEFLIHQLSNYYDTPDTIYEKDNESFENGELFYIYRATEKKSGDLLGIYKFPAELDALYEEKSDGEYELVWSIGSFKTLED